MSSFWKNIKDLFNSAEASSPNQPVIHELIERSESEKIAFDKWKMTLGKRRLLDWLKEAHFNYKMQSGQDPAIDFLNTPSAKGFVIHFHQTKYPIQEITFFFDFLKEKIRTLGYKSSLSDTRTYNRKDWVEKLERHYLKPPTNLRNPGKELFDQRFGNVTIELLFRNDKVHHLKFSATIYKDRLYKEAEKFDDLMKELYAI